jgi:hypothetical protein
MLEQPQKLLLAGARAGQRLAEYPDNPAAFKFPSRTSMAWP